MFPLKCVGHRAVTPLYTEGSSSNMMNSNWVEGHVDALSCAPMLLAAAHGRRAPAR